MLACGEISEASSPEAVAAINAKLAEYRKVSARNAMIDVQQGRQQPRRGERVLADVQLEDLQRKEVYFGWGHAKEPWAACTFITGAPSMQACFWSDVVRGCSLNAARRERVCRGRASARAGRLPLRARVAHAMLHGAACRCHAGSDRTAVRLGRMHRRRVQVPLPVLAPPGQGCARLSVGWLAG
jgi:hypothetical protein